MAILVTGGAGYIGSATVCALTARGDEVVVFDNLSTGHRASVPRGVRLIEADLADSAAVRQAIRDHDVRQVIHFAAFTSVPESTRKPGPYFRNNFVNALGLLEAMRDGGARHIVFSSTAAVYGEPDYVPIDEDHPKRPTNPYGLSKRMVEQALEWFDAAHGLRHVALRYFNASGGAADRGEDHDPETHLIPIVLQAALGRRESISIFGHDYPTADGTCVRDYIHIEDLAQAHLRALDYLAAGGASLQCNLGNGAGYSVRQVIDVAREVTGREIPVTEAERRPGDPSALVASSERARRELGWQPRHPELRAIVQSAWAWHSTHPDGYPTATR